MSNPGNIAISLNAAFINDFMQSQNYKVFILSNDSEIILHRQKMIRTEPNFKLKSICQKLSDPVASDAAQTDHDCI